MSKGKSAVIRRDAQDRFAGLGVPESQIPVKPRMIRTGSFAVDWDVLKCGGIPRKRITQLWAEEAQGKTLMAMRLVATAQVDYPDEIAVWIDSEGTFDFEWAQRNGVDTSPEKFYYVNLVSAEATFDVAAKLLWSGQCSIVVIDSVGNLDNEKSLRPDAFEKDKDGVRKNKKQVGGISAGMTEFIKNANASLSEDNAPALVLINQMRSKIGVLYGSPDTFPGGHALKHNMSFNLRLTRKDWLPVDVTPNKAEGLRIGVNVVKTKMGTRDATNEKTHLDIWFDNGLVKSETISAFDEALRNGQIQMAGTWVSWQDVKVQGRDNFIKKLMEDESLRNRLIKAVRNFNQPDDEVPKKARKSGGGLLGRTGLDD